MNKMMVLRRSSPLVGVFALLLIAALVYQTNSLIEIFILLMFSLCYGGFRGGIFYPSHNKSYREFLEMYPADTRKELPLGPVLLNWEDALVIGLSILLAELFNWYFFGKLMIDSWSFDLLVIPKGWILLTPLPILFVFLYVYLFGLFNWIAWKRYPVQSIMIFVGFGLVLLVLRWPVVVFTILGVMYLLCRQVIGGQLTAFPWNTDFWTKPPLENIKEENLTSGVIGNPWRIISSENLLPGISQVKALILSGLFGWVWLVIGCMSYGDKEKQEGAAGLLCMILLGFALLRLLLYLDGCYPPLNLWGRLRLGLLIQWNYDKAFIPSLLTVGCGVLVRYGEKHGLDIRWMLPVMAFAGMYCVLGLGPNLRDWLYTGSFRVPCTRRYVSGRKQSTQKEVRLEAMIYQATRKIV